MSNLVTSAAGILHMYRICVGRVGEQGRADELAIWRVSGWGRHREGARTPLPNVTASEDEGLDPVPRAGERTAERGGPVRPDFVVVQPNLRDVVGVL